METRGRLWENGSIMNPSVLTRLKFQAKRGNSVSMPRTSLVRPCSPVTASSNTAQLPPTEDIHTSKDGIHTVDSGNQKQSLLQTMHGELHQKANDLSQSIAVVPGPLRAVDDSCLKIDQVDPKAQQGHTTSSFHPDCVNFDEVKNGYAIPPQHLVGAQDTHARISVPRPTDEIDTDTVSSADSGREDQEIQSAERGIGLATTNNAASRPGSSASSLNAEQHQPSGLQADEVVLNFESSFNGMVYPFNKSGLLVGYPHKIVPSLVLQTRWKDIIEPRLCHDVEAFQKRTKPLIRRGRAIIPRLSVELRMSGHVSADGCQVTLSPTIWFLYDDKRWEKDTRRLVSDLEWLSEEGLEGPEIHKGCPRYTALQVPVEKLQLSTFSRDSIKLPEGGELYVHVEEPQSSIACGLLCCATFIQDGVVRTQHLSRIGGLMDLDAKTAAVTTAHGFLEDLISGAHELDSSYETESNEESQSDDEEPSKSEDSVGRIDLEMLDTISWSQLSRTSIQETCFFDLDGSSMDQVLSKCLLQYPREVSYASEIIPSARTLSANSRARQTGDFSFLAIPHDGLYNYYESIAEEVIGKAVNACRYTGESVYRLAGPDENNTGLVDLLLRPDRISRAHLLSGTMLFSPYGVALRAQKIVLDGPLASGCSGTWVAQKGSLLGMIIASYEDEPFAVMIPSHQIVKDIQHVFPDIKAIGLPGLRENSLSLPVTTIESEYVPHTVGDPKPVDAEVETSAQAISLGQRPAPRTQSVNVQNSSWATDPTPIEDLTGFTEGFIQLRSIAGPPVGDTLNVSTLYYKADSNTLTPVTVSLEASISGNFTLKNGEWICDREDYFSCTCSYTTSPWLYTTLFLNDSSNGEELKIHRLFVGLSAVVSGDESKAIEIFEHVPEQNSGQSGPPRPVSLRPKQSIPPSEWTTMPAEHRFERLEFSNGPKTNGNNCVDQQYCHLVVELWADVDTDGEAQQLVRVAWAESARLVIRGQSLDHKRLSREIEFGRTAAELGRSTVELGRSTVELGRRAAERALSQLDRSFGGIPYRLGQAPGGGGSSLLTPEFSDSRHPSRSDPNILQKWQRYSP